MTLKSIIAAFAVAVALTPSTAVASERPDPAAAAQAARWHASDAIVRKERPSPAADTPAPPASSGGRDVPVAARGFIAVAVLMAGAMIIFVRRRDAAAAGWDM